jgi:hypothetical protein
MNEERAHFSARVVFARARTQKVRGGGALSLTKLNRSAASASAERERVCNLLPCLHAPINLVDANLSTWMLFYSLLSQKFPLDIIIQEQWAHSFCYAAHAKSCVFFIASLQGQKCFRDLGVEMIQHTHYFCILAFLRVSSVLPLSSLICRYFYFH